MDIPSIRKDISKKTLRAANIAGNDFKKLMHQCINTYYGEYSPVLYQRTNIFRESPEKGAAVSIGLGAMITMSYVDRGGHYFNEDSTWDDAMVFESSMAGKHGGRIFGTNVWNLTLMRFDSAANLIITNALAQAGL